MPKVSIIENSKIKIGVDEERGCGICWLSEGAAGHNYLNTYDTGRFIQQSYYGAADGSDWNGKPWNWNPVQGGSWQNEVSKVQSCTREGNCLRATVTPRHWARQHLCDDCVMSQCINLQGSVAHCHFTFKYNGSQQHPSRHQELPAVFLTRSLNTLVFYSGPDPWTGGALTKVQPGPGNKYYKPSEHWAAYVNDEGYGVGIYTPICTDLTAYQVGNDLSGNTHSDCCYLAPLVTMAITPGLEFAYDTYVTVGSLDAIRSTFQGLAQSAAAS